MNKVITVLDGVTQGENGHLSYLDEKILSSMVAFDFKAMRGMPSEKVEKYLGDMIQESGIEMVFRHCSFIRDITEGKGERDVYYHYIYQLWKRYPEIVIEVIPMICNTYGSWRDMKNLYKCYHKDADFVKMLVSIIVNRLTTDIELEKKGNHISMLSKYLPGEKTAQKGLAKKIAKEMFKNERDCMKKYRKVKSHFTKTLNIVERNLCGKTMENIVMEKIPSRAMKLYLNTFMNIKKGGNQRSSNEKNIEFSKKFKEFIMNRRQNGYSINSRGIEIRELVRDILLNNVVDESIIEGFVNDMKQKIGARGNVIPVIDTSGSMYGRSNSASPINGALGLGILLSMVSSEPFRNRFITFSDNPTWFECKEDDTFIERINKAKRAEWGYSTDYYKTIKLILSGYIKAKIPAKETKDVILAVFSDMQFNQSSGNNMKDVMEEMKAMFVEAGISTVGEPYYVPKMIFWNLRMDTNNIPVQSNECGVTMISGFNQVLMNTFIQNPHQLTPEQMLKSVLIKPRYNIIGDLVRKFN
jgi:hypothetical protein